MILRRVIEHFRKQEWTAIFLDFVIVVMGVFVGIQVSNWNAARATDIKSREVTALLIADLRDEAWGYQYLLDYNSDVTKNADRALDAIEGRAPLSDEALLIAAYRATQYREPRRRRRTYDQLMSTGEMELVRDRALRNLAIALYTTPMFGNIREEGARSNYRQAFRMAVPVAVQRAIAKSCGDRDVVVGDYKSIVTQLDYPCETGLTPAALAEAAEALKADPLIAPYLRLRIADLETRRADMLAPVNRNISDGLRAISKDEQK